MKNIAVIFHCYYLEERRNGGGRPVEVKREL